MNLVESYETIRECVVALSIKDIPTSNKGIKPGIFPTIFATGFVVREDGLIITNDHVINAIRDLMEKKIPAIATLFKKFSLGYVAVPLDVIGGLSLKDSPVKDIFNYGPKIPDIGFIRIRQQGLPTVKLNDRLNVLTEGVEVGTAGFPLGTTPLRLTQSVGPTLQRGIICAVFPFPGTNPHGFAINVMSHPGASGSPVFLSNSGEVIGIVYGGLAIPANFTYVIPSRYITACLSMDLTKVGLMPFSKDVPYFSETVKDAERVLLEGIEEAKRNQK